MAKNLYTRQAGKHQAAPNMAQPHRSLNASPKPEPIQVLLGQNPGEATVSKIHLSSINITMAPNEEFVLRDSLSSIRQSLGRPSPLMALLTTLRGTLTFLLLQGKSEADLIVCPGISITSYLSRRSFPCEDTFLLHSLLNSMLNEVLIL